MFKSESKKKHGVSTRLLVMLAITFSLLIVGLILWWFRENTRLDNDHIVEQVSIEGPTQPEITEQNISSNTTETDVEFDSIKLQAVLDNWSSNIPGVSSVVLMDEDGNLIASINKDRVYFAASIYKLYVAYAGYLEVDAGIVNADESYINGRTREECLDLMIRESDSPCAEKLWVELGKQELTEQLKGYGIDNTSMLDITTTSYDAAVMLARVSRSEGLSEDSKAKLLKSMEEQIYRDALNAGFSANTTVYNKVGFRDIVEYHDTAIVELADDRRLIVSVLTEEVGTRNISALATAIEETVKLQ